MTDLNPYAAPEELDPAEALMVAALAEEGPTEGVWRKGNLLIMRKDAVLPDRCVKTNQPAYGRRIRMRFNWCHPLALLGLFLWLVGAMVLYFIFRQTAVVELGVSESVHSRRRSFELGGTLAFCAGILMMFSPALLPYPIDISPFVALSGLILLIGGLVVAQLGSTLITAKRITRDHVWLKGVHPDYLDMLAEWPYD